MRMAGSHDAVLVALSIVIAVVASYTALDLAGRIRASAGHARTLWLGTAAIAMGGGIWSMHFVAMLAFSMPGMVVSYDVGLTILSLIVAIAATGAGFVLISRPRASAITILASGVLMGIGVVAMHYMGMAAMRMPVDLRYDHIWVAASVLVAIGAATAALWLTSRNSGPIERIAAAAMMGIAIAGMHYTGMQAAIFTALGGADRTAKLAGVGQTSLAVAVATTTFLILFLALIAATFDRRFATLALREAQALRESEERFRLLYQRTPLPLQSLDMEGHIIQASDAWLRLTGYEREEVIGRPFVDFLVEASASQARQGDWQHLLGTGSLEGAEYRIITKDGRFLDVIAAATVERDPISGIVHVLGGVTDVTARKQAEEALRQAHKIEAIGQLTGGIAHDFNNLLAVIIGNLELLARRLPEDPKARQLVNSAMEGATRGASLTQRLLAFARRQDLQPEKVDVPSLVRGMTDLLQRSIGPMIRVETHFPLRLPPARVDAHQLEMAVLNLAVNARDAMPAGGTLTIAAEEHEERPGASGHKPGKFIKLSLIDTGEGMDPATLARAVDPFFTTKGVGKGTGLGLSMVQGLAAQSDGWFSLNSERGGGTVAALYLPVSDVPADETGSPAKHDRSSVSMPIRSLAVLVTDDDNLVLANTSALLDDLGHDARLATSGLDALAKIENDAAIELLITDQLMPGMTGLELIERARKHRPDLPVLLVSGFAELEHSAAVEVPLLRKPFTQRQLAEAMQAALEKNRVIPIRRAGP